MEKNKVLIVVILILTTSVTIMSTDIYTPSLPHLSNIFNTTPAIISLSISLATLTFGFAMLAYGPLVDTYGRRPILLFGMIGFTLFTAGCALASSAQTLIIGRILQNSGAAVEGVVVLAMIKDLFDEKESVKVLGIYGMAVAISPAIAPILGGYIHVTLGWQFNFWLIAILGLLVTLLIFRYIPESGQPCGGRLQFRQSLRGYGKLLRNRVYMRYSLCLSFYFASLWAFIVGGPFIFINIFEVEAQHFGYYQAVVVISFILGSSVANGGANRVPLHRLIHFGLAMGLLGSMLLIAVASFGQANPWAVTLSVGVIVFGLGPLFAVAPVKALKDLAAEAGSAAALLGAMEMTLGSIAGILVGTFYNGTVWPTVIVIVTCVVLAIAFYCFYKENSAVIKLDATDS